MKTCQRCLQPQKKKSEHGQYICPLEPRTSSSLVIKHTYSNYNFGTKDKDTLQPTMKDGTINREFVQAYGTKTVAKEFKISESEVRKQADRPTATVGELRQKHA